MNHNATRSYSFWMLILTFSTLFISYSLEYVLQLEPCPLCLMQRFFTVLLAFLCLGQFTSAVWAKKRVYLFTEGLLMLLGLVLASRQFWLQSQGGHDNSLCMPGFEAILNYFSWDVIIQMLFWGSNDCATVAWRLMGMPLSAWSMGYFLLMMVLWIGHYRQINHSKM